LATPVALAVFAWIVAALATALSSAFFSPVAASAFVVLPAVLAVAASAAPVLAAVVRTVAA